MGIFALASTHDSTAAGTSAATRGICFDDAPTSCCAPEGTDQHANTKFVMVGDWQSARTGIGLQWELWGVELLTIVESPQTSGSTRSTDSQSYHMLSSA